MQRQTSSAIWWSAALLLLLVNAGAARAQSDTIWSTIYLADLDAARASIAANHPGMVDVQNPAFARTLVSAYEEARQAATQVNSYSSYHIALARFGNRFQDAHLSIGGRRPLSGTRGAGIYPVFRGRAFVVEDVDDRYGARGSQLRGATLRDCNGRPADALFRERVLSWRGRPSIEADWHLWAPLLLVDYGPPPRRRAAASA